MEQQVNNNMRKTAAEAQGFNVQTLKDMFFICLAEWYWFALTIIVCLIGAYLYLGKTQPQWTRTAQVEIKDDRAGKSIGGAAKGLTDIGLFNTTSTVDNEKYMFMSYDVMMEVVKRLKLQDNYFVKGRLRTNILYGKNLPIEVVLPDAGPDDSYSMKIKFTGDEYEVSHLRRNAYTSSDVLIGKVGQTIKTPIGRVNINPTLSYRSDTMTVVFNHGGITNTTTSWNARVGVAIADKLANVITLSLTDVSAERAEDVLGTLIQVYNERWVTDKNQATLATLDFIREKLKALENDLSGVDQTISEFKSRNMLPDVESAAQMYMTKNQQVQDQVIELSSQLEMGKYIRDFLRKSSRYALIPSGTGLNATALEAQIKDYNDLVLKRQSIINNSSINSTLLPSIEQQLQIIKQSIQKGLENQTVAIETQISQLRSNERMTQSRIQATPKQAKVLLSVERQQQVKQTLYMFLLQKREENELSCAFTAYNTRIVVNPHGSLMPTSPKRQMVWLIAIVLGIALPFVFFYAKKLLTTTLQNKEELKKIVTIPLVAEIPDVTKHERTWLKPWKKPIKEDNLVVVEKGNRNVINEAFRLLRTNVEFVSKEQKYQIFATTSYNVNSGKTFITMNEGLSFALQKKNVLLMDCDIRKASLSKYVDSPKKGLTDYLAGYVSDYHDVIVQYKDYETLHVLPVGTIPPNPTELISSPAFVKLLENLRKEYDYILIDCPPVDIVADTHIINQYIDQTCFIVRAGLMEKSLLQDLEDMYKEGKLKNPIMVLNGVSYDAMYGYGHKYGYGYGHKYGYGYGRRYGYGRHYGYGDYYTEDNK